MAVSYVRDTQMLANASCDVLYVIRIPSGSHCISSVRGIPGCLGRGRGNIGIVLELIRQRGYSAGSTESNSLTMVLVVSAYNTLATWCAGSQSHGGISYTPGSCNLRPRSHRAGMQPESNWPRDLYIRKTARSSTTRPLYWAYCCLT